MTHTKNQDGFKQTLTAQKRTVAAGVVAVLIAICAFYFVRNQKDSEQVNLYQGIQLSEIDLSQMQIALSKAGLNDFEIENGNIRVPMKFRDEYIKALYESDAIPPRLIVARGNQQVPPPWSTGLDRKRIKEKDRINRINSLLSQLEFVEQAWVEFDEAATGGFSKEQHRTAMVVVRKRDQQFLNELEVVTIRHMLRGAVAGLNDKSIVVTDLNASVPYTHENYPDTAQLRQRIAQQVVRNRLKHQLQIALVEFQGVEIRISPILKPSRGVLDALAENSARTTPDSPVVDVRPDDNHMPGANRPFVIKKNVAAKPPLQDSKPVVTVRSPQNVSVEIEVPMELTNRVFAHSENRKQTREEVFENLKQQVERIAQKVIGNSEVRASSLLVSAGRNVIPQSSNSIESADNRWPAIKEFVFKNWVTLSLIGFGLIGIMVLTIKWQPGGKHQSTMGAATVAPQLPAAGQGQLGRVHQPQQNPYPSKSTASSQTKTSNKNAPASVSSNEHRNPQDQMKAEIAQMIKSNPQKAAEILKSWMKDAA